MRVWGLVLAILIATAPTSCGEGPRSPLEPIKVRNGGHIEDHLNDARVRDLVAINTALLAHYAVHGQYPRSPGWWGFANVISNGPEWIPGLAPDFISALPREPRLSTASNQQYWYSSDGVDYKLIVVGVDAECSPAVQRTGVRIDPARASHHRCGAFGFWTQGRRNW